MEEKTIVNRQGKTATLKTVIPSTVKKVLNLKAKDKIIWHISTNGETKITIKKE